MNCRGQVGFEYLVFTVFLLGVAVIMFAYSFTSYTTTVQITQTQSIVNQVARAIDFVYAKGPGNAVLVDVKLPAGMTQFRVDQNYVYATIIPPFGGITNIYSFTKAHIATQSLYVEEGIYTLRIAMNDINASVNNV